MMADTEAIEMMPRRRSHGVHEGDTDYQPVNWKRVFLTPKYLVCWIVALVAMALTVVITLRHDQVVAYLRPWSEKVRDLPAGWLIPIAILILISFPPLFGHEIVALLCGVVYGLWIGFAIVAAGTFLGELGTWFAFKYCFRREAAKLERTNIDYGALARLTRDGGFWIVLLIRLSALPSHFSTAVFSTCGVRFLSFALATLLTLPKQIFLVYLGTLLLQDKPDHSHTAKNAVFGIACGVTVGMAGYILYKMRRVKRVLLADQEVRRKGLVGVVVGGAVGAGSAGGRGDKQTQVGTLPTRGGESKVVRQEEVGGGLPGTTGTPAYTPLGLQHGAVLEHQRAAGAEDVGGEPVRERAWV